MNSPESCSDIHFFLREFCCKVSPSGAATQEAAIPETDIQGQAIQWAVIEEAAIKKAPFQGAAIVHYPKTYNQKNLFSWYKNAKSFTELIKTNCKK